MWASVRVCSLSAPVFVLHCIAFSSDFLADADAFVAATAKPETIRFHPCHGEPTMNQTTPLWFDWFALRQLGACVRKSGQGSALRVESAKWNNKKKIENISGIGKANRNMDSIWNCLHWQSDSREMWENRSNFYMPLAGHLKSLIINRDRKMFDALYGFFICWETQ